MRPAFAWGRLVAVTEGGREVVRALSAAQVEAAMVAAAVVADPTGADVRRARDLEAWRLTRRGVTYARAGEALGISASGVANAVRRVREGRYGEVSEDA